MARRRKYISGLTLLGAAAALQEFDVNIPLLDKITRQMRIGVGQLTGMQKGPARAALMLIGAPAISQAANQIPGMIHIPFGRTGLKI